MQMMEQFVTDPVTVLFTVVILAISVLAYKKNKQICQHLDQLDRSLNQRDTEHPFVREITQKIQEQTRHTDNKLNVPSFIEAYMSEYKMLNNKWGVIKHIKWIHSSTSTLILLGVLGTFIGLVLSLSQIDTNQINQSIFEVLDGMYTAFFTSILGILSSLTVNYLLKHNNAEQLIVQIMLKTENYLLLKDNKTSERKMLNALVDIKVAIREMKQSFVDIQEFNQGFEQATLNMNKFNDMFGQNTQQLSDLFGNMQGFTKSFNQRMKHLNEDFARLFNHLERKEQAQEEMFLTVQQTASGVISFIEGHSAAQAERDQWFSEAAKASLQTKDDLQKFLTSYTEKLFDAYEAMTDFYQESLTKQERMIELQRLTEAKNSALMTSVEAATSTMQIILENGAFDQLSDFTRSFSESMSGMENQYRQLLHYFQKADQQQEDYVAFYQKVMESLQSYQLNQKELQDAFIQNMFGFVQKNEEISEHYKQFDQNSTRVTENIVQLAHEMNETFRQNYGQFQQQAQTLQDSLQQFVHTSSENLERIVSKMDANLGKNVENSLSSFERYVRTTNAIIENQFTVMVEHTKTHLQANAFSAQALQESINQLNRQIAKISDELEKKSQSVPL